MRAPREAEIKGVSSHLATHGLSRRGFAWQSGYSAFTVSPDDVPAVRDYILDQKRHHACAVEPDLELAGN